MKDKIAEYLLSPSSNHIVRVLIGPPGAGKARFLLNDFKLLFQRANPSYCVEVIDDPSSKTFLQRIVEASKKETPVLFLAENIYASKDYQAAAEVVCSSPHLRMVATSNSWLPYDLADHIRAQDWWPTASRGRISRIFFPASIWEDYKAMHPHARPLDFLFDEGIDQGILSAPKWSGKTEKGDRIAKILLRYSGRSLSQSDIQRIYQSEYGEPLCKSTAAYLCSDFENFCFFYRLGRFDVKKEIALENGGAFYPVTNAMFGREDVTDEAIVRRGETALVAELFYHGFAVCHACHSSQRSDGGVRTHAVMHDGLLLSRGGGRTIAKLVARIDDEAVSAMLKIPSGYKKTLVSAEMTSPVAYLRGGVEAMSLEYALSGGLANDRVP